MYTISLVANKLSKNMIAFAEDFSNTQDDKNVLLNNNIYVIPKSNKKWQTFSLCLKRIIYQNNQKRQIVVLIDRKNTRIWLDAVKRAATKICLQSGVCISVVKTFWTEVIHHAWYSGYAFYRRTSKLWLRLGCSWFHEFFRLKCS